MTQPRIILDHEVVTNPMLETGKIYLHPETLKQIDAVAVAGVGGHAFISAPEGAVYGEPITRETIRAAKVRAK